MVALPLILAAREIKPIFLHLQRRASYSVMYLIRLPAFFPWAFGNFKGPLSTILDLARCISNMAFRNLKVGS